MDNVNSQLKSYLSKSSTNNGSLNDKNGKKSSALSWFSMKTSTASDDAVNDTSNGWFTQAQADPLLPSLTRQQRVLGFVLCLLMGTFCFCVASLYLPFLLLKARKFAMLYTMGSLFIISSFALLWGPVHHMKHLFSMERLPFTTAYFGTMFATIYFSIWVNSTVLTVVFAVIQILALIWYIVSYIPGGQTGLKFFSKVFYATASKTASSLPI